MADGQDVSAVARVLALSERQVQELARDGIIPRTTRGTYDLLVCVQSYVKHIREVAAGRSSTDGKLDIVAERARLAREQADHYAMKNAVMREQLVPAEDIEAAYVSVQSAVQRRILAVPKAVAALVSIESEARVCEAIIRQHLEEALEEIADADLVVTLEQPEEPAEAPAN